MTNKPQNDDTIPVVAINNLIENQKQLDVDGVMVGVSRQALHEVISYINRAEPAKFEEEL